MKKFEYLKTINDGEKCLQLGKYKQAKKHFIAAINEASNAPPNDTAKIYGLIGETNEKLKNMQKALDNYNKSISLNPNSPYYIKRAIIYENDNQYEAAFSDYLKSIKYHKNNVFLLDEKTFNHANIFVLSITNIKIILQKSKNQNTLNSTQNLELLENINNAIQYTSMGDKKISVGDEEGICDYIIAIKLYDKAINIAPTDPKLYLERGILYTKIGASLLARGDFISTIALDNTRTLHLLINSKFIELNSKTLANESKHEESKNTKPALNTGTAQQALQGNTYKHDLNINKDTMSVRKKTNSVNKNPPGQKNTISLITKKPDKRQLSWDLKTERIKEEKRLKEITQQYIDEINILRQKRAVRKDEKRIKNNRRIRIKNKRVYIYQKNLKQCTLRPIKFNITIFNRILDNLQEEILFARICNTKLIAQISRKKYMLTPQNVKYLLHILEKFAVSYITGGAVRDILLNIPINDIDIITSASPKEIFAILKCFAIFEFKYIKELKLLKIINTCPTIDILCNKKLRFGLISDANKRDLTINALYLNSSGNVIDPLNTGFIDLKARIARMIGYPHLRLANDPLITPRIILISEHCHLNIDNSLKCAIINGKHAIHQIQHIPAHKIIPLFKKFFLNKKSSSNLVILKKLGIIESLFPFLEKLPNENWNWLANKLTELDKKLICDINIYYVCCLFAACKFIFIYRNENRDTRKNIICIEILNIIKNNSILNAIFKNFICINKLVESTTSFWIDAQQDLIDYTATLSAYTLNLGRHSSPALTFFNSHQQHQEKLLMHHKIWRGLNNEAKSTYFQRSGVEKLPS